MEEITLKSPAKINLTLDILRKLPDGYHEISSIIQEISLYDEIKIEKSDQLRIYCNEPIPLKENLVLKAWKLLKNKFNIIDDVSINIKKNIPLGAGLGGGSSNAAAALKGINELFSLNLKNEELIKLASQIGMDVPFFIVGGTCMAKNRGEVIEKIRHLPKIELILANPGFPVSTEEAYKSLDLANIGKKLATEKLLKIINKGNAKEIASYLHNDFESATAKKYPAIKALKEKMISLGCSNAVMSGSGPTVFAIVEKNKEEIYNKLKEDINLVFSATTL